MQKPFGGEAVGSNPTDRAKWGTKRSLLVDGRGVPVGVTVAGANRHDCKLLEGTIGALSAPPPVEGDEDYPLAGISVNLDKGYDFGFVRELIARHGWLPCVESRSQEARSKAEIPGYRAKHWVVERSHSCINRFRRLLVRWEKKASNFLAMVHLACANIVFRFIKNQEVFG